MNAVILSEAFFSGVEGPAFEMLIARDSASEECA
jgi:hypothetical protein